MSKRNLATVTCSLFQSDLGDFVKKYGIALCYDPQLSSSEHTALDTHGGYNPLYLSLFSIADFRHGQGTFAYPYPTEPFDEDISVARSYKKKRSIIAELEEGATIIKLIAVGSSSKHEPKRSKQKGPRRSSARGSVPPLLLLLLKVLGSIRGC
ncbi:hypothetical protein Tco_0651080 [Tanacetum coccineum]